ncbi:DUF6194 family protein [Speluncibacter jeojiensis]|uniref:DUF6194 family protein n=1 Tax=Speluncibacter jeojiensis TaxID=2710754 RepID=UPI002FC65690
MDIDEIITLVSGWDGALAVTAADGDGSPALAWGDSFFYYAPDGVMPQRTQPFATIVTKNYPGDDSSRLDRPGVFRLNIDAGRGLAREHAEDGADPAAPDAFFAHPVYGAAGWISVISPAAVTAEPAKELLHQAYQVARDRYERRNRG